VSEAAALTDEADVGRRMDTGVPLTELAEDWEAAEVSFCEGRHKLYRQVCAP
jgi:hypothetical protein